MAKPLLLRSPITPRAVTQGFGESRTCIDEAGEQVETLPLGTTQCRPGFKALYLSQGMQGHNGIDFAATEGQPVYATHAGHITELATEPERGLGIGIVSGRRYQFPHPAKRNGIGRFHVKTRYWHLMAYAVKVGDRVSAGQLIGWAGNTGLSSGPHLHFELKPVERIAKGKYRNVFVENGYRGAIDPAPYLLVQ